MVRLGPNVHGFCNHIARGLILIEAYSFRIIEIKDIWTLSHIFINIFSLDLEYKEICIHIAKLSIITISLLYISIPEAIHVKLTKTQDRCPNYYRLIESHASLSHMSTYQCISKLSSI